MMKKKITILCSLIVVLSVCITIFGTTGIGVKNDVTTATVQNYQSPKSETTTNNAIGSIVSSFGGDSLGNIGDMFTGVDTSGLGSTIESFGDSVGVIEDAFGGVGDAFGGLASGFGDTLGGVFGGGLGGIFGGSDSTTVANTTTPPRTTTAPAPSSTTTEPVKTTALGGLIIPVPAATQGLAETVTVTVTVEVLVEASQNGETVDYAVVSNPYTKPTATFTVGDEDETIKWIQWIFVYTGYGLKDNGITGVLDEDTVAVVKKLQHENNLTVDGNITEDVVKAAEVLYYQSMLGEDVSAIEIASDATTGESVSNQGGVSADENDIPVALLIIVLVIIWVLAIGGIILLFVFKKKKIKTENKKEAEKAETKEENKSTEISSLSDLFEEAEKKDK